MSAYSGKARPVYCLKPSFHFFQQQARLLAEKSRGPGAFRLSSWDCTIAKCWRDDHFLAATMFKLQFRSESIRAMHASNRESFVHSKTWLTWAWGLEYELAWVLEMFPCKTPSLWEPIVFHLSSIKHVTGRGHKGLMEEFRYPEKWEKTACEYSSSKWARTAFQVTILDSRMALHQGIVW